MSAFLFTALFPELCLHCGEKIARVDFLCAACHGGVLKRPGEFSNDAIRRKFSFLYEGPAKTLFAAAKFSERRRAVNFFINAARQDLADLAQDDTLFLVVPSRKKFLHRLISACVAEEKIIWNAFCMLKQKAGDANKFLGETGRYRRIHESLQWNSPAAKPAKNYVICDDVSTTGATLGRAAYLAQTHLGVDKSRIVLWSLMHRERYFLMPRQ